MTNLIVGKTYEVRFDDCCVCGNFVDKLVSFDEESDEYVFEHITLERAYSHAIEFYLVEEE